VLLLPGYVDHVHGTKTIRGLLCPKCNFAIGHAHDDPAVLRNLSAYARRTRSLKEIA